VSGECLRHETPCPALLLLKSSGKALDAYKVALKIAPSRLNLLIGSHDGLTVSLTGVRQMVKKRHLTSNRIGSINAFHEKAGRSQVNSCFILFDTLFLFRPLAAVAMLPSALSRSDGFARCMLGVLNSAGAAI